MYVGQCFDKATSDWECVDNPQHLCTDHTSKQQNATQYFTLTVWEKWRKYFYDFGTIKSFAFASNSHSKMIYFNTPNNK